ncbi:hypothetical protein ZWY2020_051208 [Hordeum vulgare]|nr:hypothetical protein ZWY2020_051208 [Hordeum vulgare]
MGNPPRAPVPQIGNPQPPPRASAHQLGNSSPPVASGSNPLPPPPMAYQARAGGNRPLPPMPRLASGSNRPPGHTAYQAPAGSNRHLAAPVPRLSAGSNQARAYQPRVAPPAVVNTRPAAPMSHVLSAAGALGGGSHGGVPLPAPGNIMAAGAPTNSQAALTSSSSGSNKKTKNCNKCQDPGYGGGEAACLTPGSHTLNDRFDHPVQRRCDVIKDTSITLFPETTVHQNHHRIKVPLKPFRGCIPRAKPPVLRTLVDGSRGRKGYTHPGPEALPKLRCKGAVHEEVAA